MELLILSSNPNSRFVHKVSKLNSLAIILKFIY